MVNKVFFFLEKNQYNIEFDEMIKVEFDFIEKIMKRITNDNKILVSIHLDGDVIDKVLFDDMTDFIRETLNDKYINTFYKTNQSEKYLFKNIIQKPIIEIKSISKKITFIDDD